MKIWVLNILAAGLMLSIQTKALANPEIPEVELDTANFNNEQAGVPDWSYALAVKADGSYGNAVVMTFSSASEVYKHTFEKMSAAKLKGASYVARVMACRAQSFDFSQNNLAVVYLADSGPPFGEYGYKYLDDKTIEFCITRADGYTGPRGLALRIIFKIYKLAKSIKVISCKKG